MYADYLLGMWFILLVILHSGCAILASEVARTKGWSSLAWGCGGLLLGPLALLAAVGLGNRRLELILRELAAAQGGRALTSREAEELKHQKLRVPRSSRGGRTNENRKLG